MDLMRTSACNLSRENKRRDSSEKATLLSFIVFGEKLWFYFFLND